jgi:SP family arabinose:H+ symporter-like MFS transporter
MQMSTERVPASPATTRAWLFVYFACAVVSAGEFVRSFDINIMSGAILFMRGEFGMGPYEEGFTMSSAIIGCFLGSLVAGSVSDRVGRRNTLFITAALYAVSVVGTTVPETLWTFNLSRIIGGIGIGFASVVCPLYIAEIAPAVVRGRLVMMVQFAMVFGLTTSVITTYTMSLYGLSWRWMMASQGVAVSLFFIGLFWVPETPRWLLGRQRKAEAVRVLTTIVGPAQADVEAREIERALAAEEKGSYRELIQPGVRRALIVAVTLAVLSQMVGVTTLMYYAPALFQKTGLGASDALARLIILNAWNLFCTLVAYHLVDSLGRRPLLIAGTIGLSVGMALMGGVFYAGLSGTFVLIVFFICIGAYILSVAPLTWVVVSEIFPSRIRGRAISIATSALWLTVYCVTQFFPPAVAHFERQYGSAAGVFWAFSAVALTGAVFVWFCIPETKGRTLEDIGGSWEGATAAAQSRTRSEEHI